MILGSSLCSMRVWKVIKVAILAINNTVSGCLDQYISIIGKKYYIDFDIDVFVKIEEMLRVIDKEKNYYDIIGLDTKMKASMDIEFIKMIRNINEKVIIIFLADQINEIKICLEIQPFLLLNKPFNQKDVEMFSGKLQYFIPMQYPPQPYCSPRS